MLRALTLSTSMHAVNVGTSARLEGSHLCQDPAATKASSMTSVCAGRVPMYVQCLPSAANQLIHSRLDQQIIEVYIPLFFLHFYSMPYSMYYHSTLYGTSFGAPAVSRIFADLDYSLYSTSLMPSDLAVHGTTVPATPPLVKMYDIPRSISRVACGFGQSRKYLDENPNGAILSRWPVTKSPAPIAEFSSNKKDLAIEDLPVPVPMPPSHFVFPCDFDWDSDDEERVSTGEDDHGLSSYFIYVDEDDPGEGPHIPLAYSLEMEEDDKEVFVCMGTDVYGAYKRVDRRVKPVPGVFLEDARVERRIPEDPLLSLPPLTPHPPDFVPGERLTKERLEEMNINPDGFLWPEEEKLFQHILLLNEKTLAFKESHRGTFREDYFTPYIIPVVPHEPWEFVNIPIPPGIKEKVIALLTEKIAAGVYEPSQSSYRSRWFCVMKKSGKLRIVHDLQPLNRVTIRDAGLPPQLDDFVEPFAG